MYYLFVQSHRVLSQKTRCSSEQCSKLHGDDVHRGLVLPANDTLNISFVPQDIAIDRNVQGVRCIVQYRNTDVKVCNIDIVHLLLLYVLSTFHLKFITKLNFI